MIIQLVQCVCLSVSLKCVFGDVCYSNVCLVSLILVLKIVCLVSLILVLKIVCLVLRMCHLKIVFGVVCYLNVCLLSCVALLIGCYLRVGTHRTLQVQPD